VVRAASGKAEIHPAIKCFQLVRQENQTPKKFQLCRFPDVSATARKKENGNMFDVKLESVGRFFFSQTFGYRNVRWRDAIQSNAFKHSFVPPPPTEKLTIQHQLFEYSFLQLCVATSHVELLDMLY
jgi:hypothetical protein